MKNPNRPIQYALPAKLTTAFGDMSPQLLPASRLLKMNSDPVYCQMWTFESDQMRLTPPSVRPATNLSPAALSVRCPATLVIAGVQVVKSPWSHHLTTRWSHNAMTNRSGVTKMDRMSVG